MKILHIVPSLALNDGGPPRSVIGMVRAQAVLGADVKVVAGFEEMEPEILPKSVHLDFGRLACPRFSIPSSDLAKKIRCSITVADLIHLHSIWNGTISYAGWRCRIERKPTVLSPRGMLDQHNILTRRWLKMFWLKFIEQRNIAALKGFHFQDECERSGCVWLGKHLEKPCLIQPNGVDIRQLEVQLASLPPCEFFSNIGNDNIGRFNLVFLGRLHPIKGLSLQVELLEDLRDAGINAHLFLIGPDDGEGSSLKNYAEHLGMQPYLHLLGPIYDNERLRWLRDADAVLLTSYNECNSNTATETMAVGGVVVATDTCHLDRPLRQDAAIVVPRERKQLFNAVIELVKDPNKSQRVRKAARSYAKQQLDWSNHASEMLEFYEKVVQS